MRVAETTGAPIELAILHHDDHAEPSLFTAAGLLREARRQKQLPSEQVPRVCLLDPDGDIADHLHQQGRGHWSNGWACYHSQLLLTTIGDHQVGIVPRAVGAPTPSWSPNNWQPQDANYCSASPPPASSPPSPLRRTSS